MKKLILISIVTFLFNCQKGVAQEPHPELLDKTWFLSQLTLDNIEYNVNDYGYDPPVHFITQSSGEIFFFIDQPTAIGCKFINISFFENPLAFLLPYEGGCLADNACYPDDIPCFEIYNLHYSFYIDSINTVITYEIIENTDGSQSLRTTNLNNDQAYYNNFPLGVEDLSSIKISTYPNPTSNTLFITSKNLQMEQLSVFNLSGQKVMELEEITNEIDVSSLQNGIYFLKITSEEGTAIKKFLKK